MASFCPKVPVVSLKPLPSNGKNTLYLSVLKGTITQDFKISPHIISMNDDLCKLFIGATNHKLGDNSSLGILKKCTTKELFDERKEDFFPPLEFFPAEEVLLIDRIFRTLRCVIAKSECRLGDGKKLQEVVLKGGQAYLQLLPPKKD